MLPDVNYLRPTEFLIRAKPERIELSESYEQKIQQNIAVSRSDGAEPSGKIEIVVPYDGAEFFGKSAEYDAVSHELREDAWLETEALEVRGRVGYVYFQSVGKSDLVGQLQASGLWSHDQMMPVEVTLRDIRGRRFHRPLNDEYSCKLQVGYKPDLGGFPVDLKLVEPDKDKPERLLHISDEEKIISDDDDWRDSNEILGRLRRQAPLNDQYEIPIQIKLEVKFLSGDELPEAMDIELQIDCPTYESASLITLSKQEARDDEDAKIEAQHRIESVDESAGFLVWSGVPLALEPFEPTDDTPERKEAVYKSVGMVLRVKEPVMFRDVKTLGGRLKCAFDWSFSGVKLLYFNAYGQVNRDASSLVKAKSSVLIGFDIQLKRFSQDKLSVPYQRFQFSDVRFEEDRVGDLIKVLRELSFEFDPVQNSRKTIVDEKEAHEPTFTILQDGERESEANGRLIHVKKMVGEREIVLYIHIYGFQMVTKRERHAHAGQDKYTSDRPTGHTVVDMGGRSYGDSKRLVAMMNAIHDGLKDSFGHASSGS